MAEGLHVNLCDLIYASNETPNARIYFARPAQGAEMMNSPLIRATAPSVSPSLEIRPQTIREEATVYAVFAIE